MSQEASPVVSDNIAKRLLLRVMGENRYYAVRAQREFKRVQSENKEIVFIHQMGKVGSTAISASLKAIGYEDSHKVYQTHFLTPEGIEFVERLETGGQGGWDNLPAKSKNFLTMSRVLGQELKDGFFAQDEVKVISLVRDPVATNLSGFFHNYRWWPQELQRVCRSRTGNYLTALKQRFLTTYPHQVPLTWFDMEMKPLFGIDIYSEPFDRQQGYHIYNGDNRRLLLVKLESLRDCAEEAFNTFLELDNFELVRANEADDKWYAQLYKEFKAEVALPESYLDQLYDTTWMTRFYSAEEISAFRDKWTHR